MKPPHLVCFFLATFFSLGACNSWLDERDYGFLFWPKNHKSGDGGYDDIEHIQTGTYGLVLDVSKANLGGNSIGLSFGLRFTALGKCSKMGS